MPIGLVGRKCGMTRVFTDAGESIPVTVIEALPNRVAQLKTVDCDGYRAVQVTFGSSPPSRAAKPLLGHCSKAEVDPGQGLWEFRLEEAEGDDLAPGTELHASYTERMGLPLYHTRRKCHNHLDPGQPLG